MPKPYDHHVKVAQGRSGSPSFNVPDLSKRMPSGDWADVEVDGRVRRVYGQSQMANQVQEDLRAQRDDNLYGSEGGGFRASRTAYTNWPQGVEEAYVPPAQANMQGRFPVSYAMPATWIAGSDGRVSTGGGAAGAEYDQQQYLRYHDPERGYLRRNDYEGLQPVYGIDVNDPGNRRRMSLERTPSGMAKVTKDPIPQGPPLPWEPGGQQYERSRNDTAFNQARRLWDPKVPESAARSTAPVTPGSVFSADEGQMDTPFGPMTASEWNAIQREQAWVDKRQAESPMARTYRNYGANVVNMSGLGSMLPGGPMEADPRSMDPYAWYGAALAQPALFLGPGSMSRGAVRNLAPVTRNWWTEGLTALPTRNPLARFAAQGADMGVSSFNPLWNFNKIQNRNLGGLRDIVFGAGEGAGHLAGRYLGTQAFTQGVGAGQADANANARSNPLASDAEWLRLFGQGMGRGASVAPVPVQLANLAASLYDRQATNVPNRLAAQGGVKIPGFDTPLYLPPEDLQAISDQLSSGFGRTMTAVNRVAAPFSGSDLAGPRERRDLDMAAEQGGQTEMRFAQELASRLEQDPDALRTDLEQLGQNPMTSRRIVEIVQKYPELVQMVEQRPDIARILNLAGKP